MLQAENFKEYIITFEERLELVVADDISAEIYIKKYLAHLLVHKTYYVAIYADVLHKLIHHSSKNKSDILLIDFGAGNGLLGIFAKFCGFKKVFLNDIDAKFIRASEKLSAQLDIKIDGYIKGDISATQAYFKNEVPDAIIGTDVIEHIYNLGIFFTSLPIDGLCFYNSIKSGKFF
jgi:2-polyprenyl-3-methyl-5-hydroxy-6-metoxy-1,4-benzoquinol methylase